MTVAHKNIKNLNENIKNIQIIENINSCFNALIVYK